MIDQVKSCQTCRHLRTQGHDVFTNQFCIMADYCFDFDGRSCCWYEHDDSRDQDAVEEE